MSVAPPRRRRLQLHLSTCVLLMLVCGALMWLNFRVRDMIIKYDYAGRQSGVNVKPSQTDPFDINLLDPKIQEVMVDCALIFHAGTYKFSFQGWPWDHRIHWSDATGHNKLLAGSWWYTSDLLKNATCGFVILAGLAVVCELLIRRAGASGAGSKTEGMEVVPTKREP